MGPFSLYTAATCQPAQQVHAGQVFDLDQPTTESGVTLFRRSLWLPLSAAACSADALNVADGSALALRFEALDVDARTDDAAWMPKCELSGDYLHFALALPLPIVELIGTRSIDASLHRRDGEAVTDEAVTGGRLNTPLREQVSGLSFALRMSTFIEPRDRFEETLQGHVRPKAARTAKGARGFGPVGDVGIVDDIVRAIPLVRRDGVLKAIRLAGRPTNPRMRLVRPASGETSEDALWLELRPGEHPNAQTLPADALAKAWAPALEHCLADKAEANVEPLLLRLDLESDAPCRITVQVAALSLTAETELLPSPQTLRFSGTRSEALAVSLASAAAPIDAITVKATVDRDASAPIAASALPCDGRTGTLLGQDQRIVRSLDLATPLRLSGITLPWHPLSERAAWTVQLCADASDRPTLPSLIEATVHADTPVAAWIALRWPAIDLQGGRYWLRLVAKEGSGLWLHAASGSRSVGWIEAARTPQLAPLPLGGHPAMSTLTPANVSPFPLLRMGQQAWTFDSAEGGPRLIARLEPAPQAPVAELQVEADQCCRLTIESVRVSRRL